MLPSCAHTSPGPALPAAARAARRAGRQGTRFMKDGKPFFISGFNYWAGPTLARDGNQAGWDQVRRDLDGMQAGRHQHDPDLRGDRRARQRAVPDRADDPAGAGPIRSGGRRGRDALARGAQAARSPRASSCSTTSGSGRAASPSTCRGRARARSRIRRRRPAASWDRFQKFSGSFYKNDEGGKAAYDAFIKLPGAEAGGQPDGDLGAGERAARHDQRRRRITPGSTQTARLIKSLAPGQLVTTGSEGQTQTPAYAGMDVVEDHQSAAIDFICFHMWAAELGLGPQGEPGCRATRRRSSARRSTSTTTRRRRPRSASRSCSRSSASRATAAATIPRRRPRCATSTSRRSYTQVQSLLATTPMAGIMPWAWAGDVRPPRPGAVLEAGRPVHRRSAPRGAGLVQRLRQGHDAEADHGMVATDRGRGARS